MVGKPVLPKGSSLSFVSISFSLKSTGVSILSLRKLKMWGLTAAEEKVLPFGLKDETPASISPTVNLAPSG